MNLLTLSRVLVLSLLTVGIASAQKKVDIHTHIEGYGKSDEYRGYKLKEVVSDSAKLFGVPDRIEYWLLKRVVFTYLSKTDSTDLEVRVAYDISELNGKYYRTIEVIRRGYQMINERPFVGFPRIK